MELRGPIAVERKTERVPIGKAGLPVCVPRAPGIVARSTIISLDDEVGLDLEAIGRESHDRYGLDGEVPVSVPAPEAKPA